MGLMGRSITEFIDFNTIGNKISKTMLLGNRNTSENCVVKEFNGILHISND